MLLATVFVLLETVFVLLATILDEPWDVAINPAGICHKSLVPEVTRGWTTMSPPLLVTNMLTKIDLDPTVCALPLVASSGLLLPNQVTWQACWKHRFWG